MQARYILPLVLTAMVLDFAASNGLAKTAKDESARFANTTVTDGHGETVARSRTIGATTWVKDSEGRAIGKAIEQPDGSIRITDPQGRTLYKTGK